MISLAASSCCAINGDETEPVLSLNGDGLLFIVPTISEKEQLSSASADIYTVAEASANNLLDYCAIALPIDYVDSFNLSTLYNNNVLIYLYGNQVSVDAYTNSVGTDSFGSMAEDINGTPSKVLVAQEQVFLSSEAIGLQRLLILLLMEKSQTPIFIILFFRIILTFLLPPIRLSNPASMSLCPLLGD